MSAVPGGLVAGFLAWFAAGGHGALAAKLEPVQLQLAQLRATPPGGLLNVVAADGGEPAPSAPIFTLTTGPDAVPEPQVRVDGVVRAGRRIAALIAIDGGRPDWLAQGEMRDNVTLVAVSASGVVVDTVYGPKAIELGANTGPVPGAQPASSASQPATAGVLDRPPPGFRNPPPPASAPGLR